MLWETSQGRGRLMVGFHKGDVARARQSSFATLEGAPMRARIDISAPVCYHVKHQTPYTQAVTEKSTRARRSQGVPARDCKPG